MPLTRHIERHFTSGETVRDIVIGGVRLTGTYRAQFDRIIRRSSYAELSLQVAATRDELLARRRTPAE